MDVVSLDAVYIWQETNMELFAVKWFPNYLSCRHTEVELNQLFRDAMKYVTITEACNKANVMCEEMYEHDGWMVGCGVILLGLGDVR